MEETWASERFTGLRLFEHCPTLICDMLCSSVTRRFFLTRLVFFPFASLFISHQTGMWKAQMMLPQSFGYRTGSLIWLFFFFSILFFLHPLHSPVILISFMFMQHLNGVFNENFSCCHHAVMLKWLIKCLSSLAGLMMASEDRAAGVYSLLPRK